MSHTNLSFILSGKRPISDKTAQRITELLELDDGQSAAFTRDAEESDAHLEDMGFDQVSLDHAALRSGWHHFALLRLLETKRGHLSPRAMAKLLGIQEIQVRAALDRLKRLGFLTRTPNKWSYSRISRTMEDSVPQTVSKSYHRHILERAERTLENRPDEEILKNFSTLILAIDPIHLPRLSRAIERFVQGLRKTATRQKSPSEVYALGIQFFPLCDDR